MIIITITYPAYNNSPEYNKDFVYEINPSDKVYYYLKKRMGEGRITRVVVKDKSNKVIWDTDRDEDWF